FLHKVCDRDRQVCAIHRQALQSRISLPNEVCSCGGSNQQGQRQAALRDSNVERVQDVPREMARSIQLEKLVGRHREQASEFSYSHYSLWISAHVFLSVGRGVV